MTITIIKNSSGKDTGYIEHYDDAFVIYSNKKPALRIDDPHDVFEIKKKNMTDDFLIHLYDDYVLNCGEIASLYEVCYSTINKHIKVLPVKTTKSFGRRNSSYGLKFDNERKSHISKSLKGRAPTMYERTPEIRKKISNSLKNYFKKHPQNPIPHIENWKKGKYKDVDFHHGIGGSMFSIKNNKKYNFRSLLELYYMLLLEDDPTVSRYEFEPIFITCDDGTTYIPDLLINNSKLIELKSRKFLKSLPQKNYERFIYKCEQANKYCLNNNLSFRVIYDDEIDFDSARMKKHLQNHPESIQKFKIIFHQPERIWSKK